MATEAGKWFGRCAKSEDDAKRIADAHNRTLKALNATNSALDKIDPERKYGGKTYAEIILLLIERCAVVEACQSQA
jgi:hypothetical protein